MNLSYLSGYRLMWIFVMFDLPVGTKKQMRDATKIIVAQRIGTIRHADQIIVLDHGRAVGIGTHKELMQTCTVYQEIARSQLSAEELEREAG